MDGRDGRQSLLNTVLLGPKEAALRYGLPTSYGTESTLMGNMTTRHACVSFDLIRLCLRQYLCLDNKVSLPDHTRTVPVALAG